MVLVLGDVHGNDPANREYLFEACEKSGEEYALQVGDLLYYQLPLPTWFIAGNNEEWDVIQRLRNGENPKQVNENLHLLVGTVSEIDGVRVAGISGNFAPTQFEKDRSELEGDRRRHFTHEDIDRVKKLSNIEILLTHEAPHGLLRENGQDVGCTHIDDVLRELEPELCLVGHHHEHAQKRIGGSKVVSLIPIWEGYYVLDFETTTLDFTSWENQSLSTF